jgi:hypothetical protein
VTSGGSEIIGPGWRGWLPTLLLAGCAIVAGVAGLAIEGHGILAISCALAGATVLGASVPFVAAVLKVQATFQRETKAFLRQEIQNVAGHIVAAAWHARPGPERVDAALPLILIAQIQRSGGTLLSQLLDGHPEVLAFPHELKWGGKIKCRWPQVDPNKEGPLEIARTLAAENLKQNITFNLFGYHKNTFALADRDEHLPFQWSQWAYVEAFIEAWEAKRPQTRRECLDIFMSSYFSSFYNWRGHGASKKIITGFTPRMNFIQSYPENEGFFEDYPDGLMIAICRHPADWFASASRRPGDGAHRRPAHSARQSRAYSDLDTAMSLWRESAESAMQLKGRHPNQVVLISFAALIADPFRSMRRIAERLGLTWHSTLVVPTFNGMPIASNSSFGPTVGIDASTLRRRDGLDPELREQIEAENLPLYQRFVEMADV